MKIEIDTRSFEMVLQQWLDQQPGAEVLLGGSSISVLKLLDEIRKESSVGKAWVQEILTESARSWQPEAKSP